MLMVEEVLSIDLTLLMITLMTLQMKSSQEIVCILKMILRR